MNTSVHSWILTLRHVGFRSKRAFRLLRAAGETETTEENIQDWLELGEGDPDFSF
jgi:hypothetical protein